jgi:hypothetical protein
MTHVSTAAGKGKVFLNTSFHIFRADVDTLCSIGHSGLGAAVRCVLHQGPLRAVHADRHQGREAVIRCKCETSWFDQPKLTFRRPSKFDFFCTSQCGSEPKQTDAAWA